MLLKAAGHNHDTTGYNHSKNLLCRRPMAALRVVLFRLSVRLSVPYGLSKTKIAKNVPGQ